MTHRRRPPRGFIALGVICAVAATGVVASASNAKSNAASPIIIGAAVAKTGTIAYFDSQAYNSFLLYVNKVNAAGGVAGHPIKVLFSDTHSDIAHTPQVAQGLISRGAKILLVSCDFDYGSPAALVAQKAGDTSWTLCATSPKFGVQGIGDKAYDVNIAGGLLGDILATYAKQRGWKAPYVLTDRSLVAMITQCNGFQQVWNSLGGKVVGTDTFLNTDSSISTQITKIQAAKPDFLVVCSYPPGGALAIRQLRSAGVTVPILSTDGMDGTSWVKSVPNISNMYITAHASIFGGSPQIAAYLKEYKATYHSSPTGGFAVTGYALAQTIVGALKQTNGNPDGSALKAVLDKFTNFPTIEGPVTFTPTVHIQLNRPLPIIEFSNGKPHYVTTVKPAVPGSLSMGATT